MTLSEIRDSGLLELYVLGHLDQQELLVVQKALAKFPELEEDLDIIEDTLTLYTSKISEQPPADLEPIILAAIDYTERLKKGEKPVSPPLLNKSSTPSDFREWLDRPDMVPPDDFDNTFIKFIAHEPEKLTALVWLRWGAPDEIHTDEYEKFLIADGACKIYIGESVHELYPGDYLTIPLHINHRVEVISPVPCKIILQRVAA